MMEAISSKEELERQLRSEQLNVRRLQKRIHHLQEGEVGELRALLTHSVKQYTDLYHMLKEYLDFSKEEMRKSLGFVPRMVTQVSAVCEGVTANPLDNYQPIEEMAKLKRPESPPPIRNLGSALANLTDLNADD